MPTPYASEYEEIKRKIKEANAEGIKNFHAMEVWRCTNDINKKAS